MLLEISPQMIKKKHINKKDVKLLVADGLRNDRSKKDILNELVELYSDSEGLVKIVAATPNPSIQEKAKYLNLLFGILTLSIVGFRFLVFGLDYVGSGLTILTLYFGITVFSYDAMAYRGIAVIAIIGFLKFFMNSNFETSSIILIDLVLTVLILRLGFHLGELLFPNYGLLGPEKDEEGKTILE